MRLRTAMSRATLFIATSTDPASLNIYGHLMKKFVWTDLTASGHDRKILKAEPPGKAPVYMWMVHEPTVHLNHPNTKFLEDVQAQNVEEVPPGISEILFLSKHAAKSGTVSLTVHPVGIPWLDDASRTGGIPGRCTPPSTHIAPLYRAVNIATKARQLDSVFQTSLEATHHGPYCDIPCCYVEIGSSENEWNNEDAGDVWSTCLGSHFALPAVDAAEPTPLEMIEQEARDCELQPHNKVAIVLIGGGHYVPKMSDMAKLGNNVFVGHCIATYALEPHWDDAPAEAPPRWKRIVVEAVQSTRVAFPHEKVVCMIDKRQFLEKQRNLLGSTLDELGISWSYKTADIKKIVDDAMVAVVP